MEQNPRASESPTRTIDSKDSTSVSVETIVDRNSPINQKILQQQATTMVNSTNTTNNFNKNSLTNSQISMISSNDKTDSHIYTAPDLMGIRKLEKSNITEKLENTLPIITDNGKMKMKNSEQSSLKSSLKKSSITSTATTSSSASSFPIHIIFGIIQLVLSVSLFALGGLLLVRGASLSTTGSGIWSGGISAIAGALGVINVRKARTGFLAVSLICVASSTLALALTGIGLVRDINRLEQNDDELILQTIKAAVSAGSGLVFALVMHFLVSILSVYQSALKLCSRHPQNTQMLENVITMNNASLISQQKVEEYIKSIAHDYHNLNNSKIRGHHIQQQAGMEKLSPENCDKLMTMWMCSTAAAAVAAGKRNGVSQKTGLSPSLASSQPPRPIMLVPATSGNGLPLPPGYRHHPGPLIFPAGILPPPPQIMMCPGNGRPYPNIPLPPPPGSSIHPDDLKALYKIHSTRTTGSELSRRHHRQRTGKNEASKRQRRKSESDMENKIALTYTGLDRAIAESFLERQEMANHSHTDYTSSNDSNRDGCPDVAM